jgi:hypothetical protein
MVQRSRYVNHANRDYNQFLNISSMPNISSFYVNNPNMQNPNMVQPQVQQMQLQQNPYNIPRPMMNNYMVPDNQIMNKQIEYPKKIVRMDDDSVVSKRARSKKSKEESEDIERKSSSKDKSNNILFYITIILLCVVIIILLMKSMKR